MVSTLIQERQVRPTPAKPSLPNQPEAAQLREALLRRQLTDHFQRIPEHLSVAHRAIGQAELDASALTQASNRLRSHEGLRKSPDYQDYRALIGCVSDLERAARGMTALANLLAPGLSLDCDDYVIDAIRQRVAEMLRDAEAVYHELFCPHCAAVLLPEPNGSGGFCPLCVQVAECAPHPADEQDKWDLVAEEAGDPVAEDLRAAAARRERQVT